MTHYIPYFDYLAQKNAWLNHENVLGKRTFDVVRQEDVKDFEMSRTDINASADYALILVLPTIEYKGVEDANGLRYHTGAFFALKKHNSRVDEKRAWHQAMPDAQRLAESILLRMVKDSKNKHPLFNRQSDTIESLNAKMLERKIGEWSGFLVTFNISNFITPCAQNLPSFNDSGLTPY